tara:strand:- start:269 stop:928 length:660 start_codon:yes stop_codon:yes gene_type:complete
MEIDTQIFAYCERSSPFIWSEPVNTLSNLFFIFFGFFWFLKGKKNKDNDVIILSISLISIGICSFLYHLYASLIFGFLDVISIIVFSLMYFLIFNQNFFTLNKFKYFLLCFSFFLYLTIFAYLVSLIEFNINGSEYYFSLIFLLFFYYLIICFKHKDLNIVMLISIIILLFSIFLRSIDKEVCDNFYIGTHFIWHFLNAISLSGFILVIYKTNKIKKTL